MKIVSIKALEDNLKLFLTNPETTDDLEEAARQANVILKYKENSSYANYAIALRETKEANRSAPMANFSKVIRKYEKIIKDDKNFIEAYLMLSNIYKNTDKQKQADILSEAHKQFPDHYVVMFDLGNIKLYHTGEKEEALELFTKCVQKLPQVDSAWTSLGTAYLMNRELEMAKTCYETALAINPDKLKAILGLGVYHFEKTEFKKAREYYDKSLMVNKDSYWGIINIALLEILQGGFERGLELYEKRDKQQYIRKYGGEAFPELLKEEVTKNSNKKIVIIKEQGHGDDIMFSRYILPFKNLGYDITFATAPELAGLFRASPDLDEIKITSEIPSCDITTFDNRTFLLSLPHLLSKFEKKRPPELKIDIKRIDSKKIKFSQKLLKKLKSKKLKVGISWSGSPKHWRDKNRSIEIKNFENLFENSNVEFFAIQKVNKESDKNFIEKFKNLTNCSEELNDFCHSAILLNQMDIVLTVDTSLVHLSGSLGKETYLFLPVVPDWRWGLKNEQTWYNSVQSLRQDKIDDWKSPIKKAEKIIKTKLSS